LPSAIPGYSAFVAASFGLRNGQEEWSLFFRWVEHDLSTRIPRLLKFDYLELSNFFNDTQEAGSLLLLILCIIFL